MDFRLKNKTFGKFILTSNLLVVIILCFNSCIEEDICTKQVNIPRWNEQEQIFEDNFQDFPCDYNGI
ncbi:hypothetical protein [Polaribacter cellanae]|uniref:Uncharacterized protein n=1 Tax=Polaribacter cellanae TaxID=2818493 RepID=A0A975CS05_9FLAO|nr:hypothetical protein [Polaribacter cellanae]QTE24202.1 hypothetical protein J3359_08050 [Polaribacter cellanae]